MCSQLGNETYLDTTISSLSERKKQLEEDLTYVQEELQKQRNRREQKTQSKQDAGKKTEAWGLEDGTSELPTVFTPLSVQVRQRDRVPHRVPSSWRTNDFYY